MATKYYIKGIGFVEDNDANRAFLIAQGRIKPEPVKADKPKKKKKHDSADTGHTESDSGNA